MHQVRLTAESERLALKAELDVKTSLLQQENSILVEERQKLKAEIRDLRYQLSASTVQQVVDLREAGRTIKPRLVEQSET